MTTTKFLPMPRLKKSEDSVRLAFYGPMASGKTFSANYLVKHFGYTKIALADKLKSVVYDLYGLTGKDGVGRKLLQEFADECKRWDSDVFIKHFLYRVKYIEENQPGPHKIICDDVRFLREAEILKRHGFTLVRVNCDSDIIQERIDKLYPNLPAETRIHQSEQQFNQIDEMLNHKNDSINSSGYDVFYNLAQLHDKIIGIL